ncbi:hypothetical protein H6F89_11530 [Cyanobacteria bacterium FACHB-63]|nr:hypothetical protein [Cyanobacteria bacterium FACHB-63]
MANALLDFSTPDDLKRWLAKDSNR